MSLVTDDCIEGVLVLNSMEYWRIINDICDQHPEEDWYSINQDALNEEFLGLKSFKKFDIPKIFPPKTARRADNFKLFHIVNKEKFLWVKLKYDIGYSFLD